MIEGVIFGAVLSFVSYWLGNLRGSRRKRPPRIPQAICGCGHHLSFHDDKGRCHWNMSYWADEPYVQCKCRQYIGPEHMPTMLP